MSDRGRPRGDARINEPTSLRRGAALPRGSAARPAVMPEPYRYTIADLVEDTGLPARTVRYYIQQGLLPPAHGRGPAATYDPSHLMRLKAIEALKRQRMQLSEIRERLLNLSDEGIAGLLDLEVEPAPLEDLWRRVELHPDLELLIRVRPGARRDERLDAFARRVARLAQDELALE